MGTGFEQATWPGPALTDELVRLATQPSGGPPTTEQIVSWVGAQLDGGATAEQLCEAALWLGLRHTRVEGRGPIGLVSHVVLAAHACVSIGDDDPATAITAATQLVAYAVGDRRGGVNDEREGPTQLQHFSPGSTGPDPAQDFLDAALAGECELADHRWLAAADHDPSAAVAALVSAGAAGYHLNEHKVIYPAQLLAWCERRGSLDPTLLRAAARFAGNHVQDPDHALARRADAGVLADIVEMEGAEVPAGDLARISTVATGLARTAPRDLGPLLLGSLQDGLSPLDLVHATALVSAARFADTTFAGPPIGAIHAGTGTNALRRCIESATSPEAVYELALCATESPSLGALSPIEELTVAPTDDGALEDLFDALDDGDPDAAADAASAVPPGDPDATAAAWTAIRRAAATDQSMLLHGVKHVVAMHEDFQASEHPARGWFLAAAARTAAHAAAGPSEVSDAVAERLLG